MNPPPNPAPGPQYALSPDEEFAAELTTVMEANDAGKLTLFLDAHPKFDPNRGAKVGGVQISAPLLHLACYWKYDQCVRALLARPGIDINAKLETGSHPFIICCGRYRTDGSTKNFDCARLLLRDRRLQPNIPGHITQLTPTLVLAAQTNQMSIVKYWIACGLHDVGVARYIPPDLINFIPGSNHDIEAAVDAAKSKEMKKLLKDYRKNPVLTRHSCRVWLNLPEEFPDEPAAEWFALIIFLCDGLLRVRRWGVNLDRVLRGEPEEIPATYVNNREWHLITGKGRPVKKETFPKEMAAELEITVLPDAEFNRLRLLAIATNLPMELQEALCLRLIGCARKDTISPGAKELGFKRLATKE